MAVFLALVGALAYGLSDFIAGITSRRVSAWSVAFVCQVAAAISTALVALAVSGTPSAGDFGWAAVAGVGNGAGISFLYRGLSRGRMSVVAPVSAVGAAVVPVLVGVAGGERLSMLVWVGIVSALPGIWLVSARQETPPDAAPGRTRPMLPAGLGDAILAGLGIGGLFAALGQLSPGAGLWPLTVVQVVSIPVVAALAATTGSTLLPRSKAVWWAVLVGLLLAGATLAFMLAAQLGYLTVSAVLTSLYPAITVLLAARVLKETVSRAQGFGLTLCAAAIILVVSG